MNTALSNKMDTSFIHHLSHDLREPARMVSQFLKLVKMRNENHMDKTSGEYLDFAISASQKMDKMIQSLSDLSKVRMKTEEVSEVQVKEVLEGIILNNEVKIASRKAQLKFNMPEVLNTRKRAFTQILGELVTNSLQHAEKESDLQLEVFAEQISKDSIQFYVFDNGAPMQEFWQEKAFDIFQKKSRDSKNLGVGLTKARMIADKCGGKMWIDIENGEGNVVNCVLN